SKAERSSAATCGHSNYGFAIKCTLNWTTVSETNVSSTGTTASDRAASESERQAGADSGWAGVGPGPGALLAIVPLVDLARLRARCFWDRQSLGLFVPLHFFPRFTGARLGARHPEPRPSVPA